MKGRNKGINMNKKQKIFILALLIGLVGGCKKDPIPEPNPTPTPDVPTDTIVPPIPGDTITPVTPGDTITPVVPGDTIVPTPPTPGGDTLQPGNYDTIPGRKVVFAIVKPGNQSIIYPSVDTILFYANHPGCDSILLRWAVPPNRTVSWTPDAFHSPRDSLRKRFVSPKVFGKGKINVNQNYGGASIPCADSLNISLLGMTECDSAIFAGWGFEPWRDPGSKSRAKQINFINTIGMGRAILGGKQH